MSRDAHAATLLGLIAVLASSVSLTQAGTPEKKAPTTKPAGARMAMTAPVSVNMQIEHPSSIAPPVEPRTCMLYAVGEGAMPSSKEQPNRAKAYLQAKAYAKMAAIASLAQEIKGTVIEYCSTGQGYAADARVKQEVKGVLDCVQVVAWKKRAEGSDTIVEVTVRAPKPLPPKAAPVAVAEKKPSRSVPSWVVSGGAGSSGRAGYSSLVIDAQGLTLAKSMSPKILRSDGSEVWGTVKVDPEFLSDHGIASYVRSRSEAFANKRAGDNPLVIRAKARGPSRWKSDVVISDSDAGIVLSEDQRSGFLGDFRVVIIVDQ